MNELISVSDIGNLYRLGGSSFVEAVKYRLECGRHLEAKKNSVAHGEWGSWMAANEDILGFGESTARKLMRAAKQPLTAVLDDDEAMKLIRQMWGNKTFVEQNTGENEWYTPTDIIEAARDVLGGFDLDPASSALANETVGAELFYTIEDDGLSQDWPIGRIWMNPPYAQPLMRQFATKYAEAIEAGSTGIALVNNATETAWFQELIAVSSAVCFHKARIRFVGDEGQSGAPLQGQAIIYAGTDHLLFYRTFMKFGIVLEHP